MTTYDSRLAIEVAPGIFHLGVQDKPNSFNNIPYLVVEGDEAALIDPGSARPEFYDTVVRKIRSVIDPRIIKYLLVSHQDPDLGASLPMIEKLAHPDVKIYAPLEAMVLLQHYNAKAPMIPVDDDDVLLIDNKRVVQFIMAPYCHFIGTMLTYDQATKTIFSSDAFGGFTGGAELYATTDYPIQLTAFLGQYLGSKRALNYAIKRIEMLAKRSGIDLICPQHGCMIKKESIPVYLQAAKDLHVGGEVDALAAKHGIKLEDL